MHRVEGFAIVSEDGMLANAAGVMPDALKFEADRHLFERALEEVPMWWCLAVTLTSSSRIRTCAAD